MRAQHLMKAFDDSAGWQEESFYLNVYLSVKQAATASQGKHHQCLHSKRFGFFRSSFYKHRKRKLIVERL